MQVTNIRERFWRRFVADPIRTLEAMRDGGVDHTKLRRLAKSALVVEELKIRGAVQSVLREMNPIERSWTIRKGLDPIFREGEIVNFTENGISRRGKIKKMGKFGATIEPIGFPMIQFAIPGSRIQKCLD